ncbi:MAG: DUF1007 family protein [Rhodobacteraceae bacterium]|nr:DUF1007 family protein [Paracoccaceae bacterium]
MLFSLLLPTLCLAHPHVFVEARSKLLFDDSGKAVQVEHVFRFDDAFSAFAMQGFDANGDGVYSRAELAELAQVNIESMAEFGYFTFGDNSRVELDFDAIENGYWLEVVTVPLASYWMMKPEDFAAMEEDRKAHGTKIPETVDLLELHFKLDLTPPTDASAPITLDVYDPTYYVDFRFAESEQALELVNAPGQCRIERKDPPKLGEAAAYALSQVGADQRKLPPELQDLAASQVNQMIVTCGSDASGAAAQTTLPTGDASSADAAKAIESNFDAKQPSLYARAMGEIYALQQSFYQKLVGAMRGFQADPNAFWILIGLSFAYGVFHAAGPGHGKAVISAYIVANNETLKKGIVLSFISAFAQAVTAVALIGGLAVVLDMTSLAVNNTARWFEVGSYGLITLLGAYLIWQKALRPLFAKTSSHSHHHHSHDHSHNHAGDHEHNLHHHHVDESGVCSTCGHAHAPTPDMLKEELSVRSAISIVLAVGLRPCSGALIVLVFALSQGMLGAGVFATFAMALGTGITVSVLASLAVGAKTLALRLTGEGSSLASLVVRTIEVGGALLVFLLGLSLLIANAGWY